MKTNKITKSGLVIALYLVIMYLTQGFAFLQYQVRLATSLYGLAYIYPFLAVPLAIANSLSNTLMGGLGLLDIVGGFVVGLTTTLSMLTINKFNLSYHWVFLPILFSPGLIVPIWLSQILGIPYLILVGNIVIGQIIPSIIGVWLVGYILRNNR